MPVRGLFIATLVLLTAGTAWAQYSNDSNQGSSSSNAPSSSSPSSPSTSDKSNLWGALAFTADGSWATAWTKPSKGEAEGNVAVAMERCNEDSRTRGRCQLRTTVCGDGR